MNDSSPAPVTNTRLSGPARCPAHFDGLPGQGVGYDLRFLDPAAAQARKADAFDAGAREAFAFAAPLEHRPRSAPGASDCRRLATAPPLNRASMAPPSWQCPPTDDGSNCRAGRRAPDDWYGAGHFRRFVLLGVVISQTCLATSLMAEVLPYHGTQPLEIAILILFAILFGWVSGGFWTAIAGFALILMGRDRYTISSAAARDAKLDPAVRTAIVMPICNEDVPRVFAGLRATYESLARTGLSAQFDFFVLSDTNDPDTRVAEIEAWFATCSALGAFGQVHYRWRQHRIKRKSGNVADFCRRWGKNYRYMVILDADSVMSGSCLGTLVRLMEANPSAGIIQSAPCAAGRDTLHARAQQFAARVYGPMFTAGLHFWQLGESHYWGHNAIIRIAPFMRHCALRRLPGRGIFSGEILSHDFVEAALMRRAGWSVWIAYDLPGSYEEPPPNLIDELKRDRRWCLGNLMNFRLSVMKGLHSAHRAVFVSGVMAYVAAPLWFAFLLLSTLLLAAHSLGQPTYFVQPYQLFPVWPEWHPEWALALFGATACLLFLAHQQWQSQPPGAARAHHRCGKRRACRAAQPHRGGHRRGVAGGVEIRPGQRRSRLPQHRRAFAGRDAHRHPVAAATRNTGVTDGPAHPPYRRRPRRAGRPAQCALGARGQPNDLVPRVRSGESAILRAPWGRKRPLVSVPDSPSALMATGRRFPAPWPGRPRAGGRLHRRARPPVRERDASSATEWALSSVQLVRRRTYRLGDGDPAAGRRAPGHSDPARSHPAGARGCRRRWREPACAGGLR
jgi:cellulose synthase/poly-beta-1,6-N-acetylglucosamine synthase-like glycosyltransferase